MNQLKTNDLRKKSTWDKFNNRRIPKLHPEIRDDVRLFINLVEIELSVQLRIGRDGHIRSFDLQNVLYQKYLNGGPKAAPPGKSFHNYGLAIDVYWIENGQIQIPGLGENKAIWLKVIDIAEDIGFKWTLKWNDPPHLVMNLGHKISELLAIHNRNELNDQGFVIV